MPLHTFIIQILVLSLLLLLGYVLYVNVRWLQRLYIPAPVIGGLIGLLLGPELLGSPGVIPADGWLGRLMESYSKEWIPQYRLLPGILITPVMASSILGLRIPGRKEFVESVGKQMGYAVATYWLQFAIGATVGGIFVYTVYPTFGLELFAGFAGGHGTSGLYGQSLQQLGLDFWQVGQGVALTTATVGLLYGVMGGIGLINILVRKGLISTQKSASGVGITAGNGLHRDVSSRPLLGRSVTAVEILEPISYTVALIAIPSLLGILMKRAMDSYGISILQSVGDYAWALAAATILWVIIERCGWSWLLDTGTKNRVTGALVDFLVVAAVASMPLQAVLRYSVPITVMLLAGMAGAVAMFYLGRHLLPNYWFERSIMTFGQSTGVTATGLLLLRVVDPDFETPALSAWGIAYATVFPFALIYMGLGAAWMMRSGPWPMALVSLGITLAGVGSTFLFRHPAAGPPVR